MHNAPEHAYTSYLDADEIVGGEMHEVPRPKLVKEPPAASARQARSFSRTRGPIGRYVHSVQGTSRVNSSRANLAKCVKALPIECLYLPYKDSRPVSPSRARTGRKKWPQLLIPSRSP